MSQPPRKNWPVRLCDCASVYEIADRQAAGDQHFRIHTRVTHSKQPIIYTGIHELGTVGVTITHRMKLAPAIAWFFATSCLVGQVVFGQPTTEEDGCSSPVDASSSGGGDLRNVARQSTLNEVVQVIDVKNVEIKIKNVKKRKKRDKNEKRL